MLSREADSLYWMSRYLERAEYTARVIDVNLVLMLDEPLAYAEQRWNRLLAGLHVPAPEGHLDAHNVTNLLCFDRSIGASIVSAITLARDNARLVREQVSSEMWEQINRLFLHVQRTRFGDMWSGQMHEFLTYVTNGSHLFHGIANATMMRGEGWHWMEVGRFIERTVRTAGLLDAHFGANQSSNLNGERRNQYLDWVGLLKSRTAFEAYCQVYTADLRPDRVAEFLLLNARYPQTVHYSLRHIQTALQAIRVSTGARRGEALERLAARLQARLEYAQIEELLAGDMHALLVDIQNQCGQMHDLIQSTYIVPPLESVLRS